ncbi:hypothetical protein SAMN04487886_12116 [Clostridium sp. DSM 8431]|uniref:hypothetical protein n=1 Tax=Clostridium sp. DSM 8431 TaxID=1761781 RepID=UPI0008E296DB|nr:hypothetical protein [Clostridium sp. DSM 8431]SFU84007.1 hypothetical protein SAMN04487886_12116 [Clostridium sp. DSM 8431]
MANEERREIKLFFLKKKVVASIFIAILSICFILNVWNLYKLKGEISINTNIIEATINDNFLFSDSLKSFYKYIEKII